MSVTFGTFGPLRLVRPVAPPQVLCALVVEQVRSRRRRVQRRVREARPVRELRVGLVERDVDQATVLERRRGLDLRDDVLEEQIGRVQPARVVDRRVRRVRVGEAAREVVPGADGVVGVAAVVRDDLVERRRGAEALEVVVETVVRVEHVRDVRRTAVAGVEDRREPGQRAVLGDVLIGRVGAARVRVLRAGPAVAGRRRRPDGRVGRTAVLGAGVVRRPRGVLVAKILGVDLPADAVGVQLVEQRSARSGGYTQPFVSVGSVRTGRRDELL